MRQAARKGKRADMTRGADYAQFPDHERPLYTPDEELKRQVAKRVKQARGGLQAHPKKDGNRPTIVRGMPMGQHPYISNGILANIWGVGRNRAGQLVRNPGDMDKFQVQELCSWCGVTLQWLQGSESENTFSKSDYEAADVIASLYNTLPDSLKASVCQILESLAGPEATEQARREHWARQQREWHKHHSDVADMARKEASNAIEVAEAFGLQDDLGVRSLIDSIPPKD